MLSADPAVNDPPVAPVPQRRGRRPTSWFTRGVIVVGIGAAAALLIFAPPGETPSFYPPCYLYALTGLHCPGCGGTRSVAALLRADIPQAAAYNPLFVVLLPPLGLWALLRWLGRRTNRPWLLWDWPRWSVWFFVAVAILFGVLRNLPFPPFDQLAPHRLD